ncbi:hypothetical protein niasHT_015575 [Heterodera trifolii]|uniref:RRP12 HEAT domain-containing protein n=1 Tax=Heterodera trifolii TaxID=157864 RepID=A0ABD2LEN0_9BILA
MVAQHFRIRAKGSARVTKGNCSAASINPKRSRHRDAARAQRIAAACLMVAVDDRQTKAEKTLLDNVPMENISLETNCKMLGTAGGKGAKNANKKRESVAIPTILDQLPIGTLSLLEDERLTIDHTIAVDLFEQLERSLNVQNAKAWPLIIEKLITLMAKAGPAVASGTPAFGRVMGTVAQFRDRDNCPVAESIDRLFAVALRSVGMESLLSAVPLNVDVDAPVLPRDFRRSWLPPILSRHAQGDSLDFFARSLFPLAERLHQRVHKLPDLPQKLYKTLEHQIWAILPRLMANAPRDFHVAMPTLAPIMGAALNDRPDLRLTILRALREALKFETQNDGICMMERYARNFLPILFGIYTASATNMDKEAQKGDENGDIGKGRRADEDNGAIRKATLETIRSYVQHQQTPQQLLTNYVGLAVQKMRRNASSSDGTMTEGQCLIADLLAALSRNAVPRDLECIFDFVEPWLCGRSSGRAQKKAYRILAEIYRRIGEPELETLFEAKRTFLHALIANGTKGLNGTVFQWRIAIFRSVLSSFTEFDQLAEFSASISAEIVAFLSRLNNRSTRHQSALCLSEMTSALIRLGLTGDEQVSASSALCPLLSNLFGELKASKNGAEPSFQCSLIALNILAQKHCRLMDASLLAQFVAYSSSALRISPAAVRPLPIRILRILSAKMEQFMFDQFKDLIIEAVFSQDTRTSTSRMRKANALLLAQLLERLELETLLKFAGDRLVWQKQLKNIEKRRRRHRRDNAEKGEEEDDESGIRERVSQRSSSGVETKSAISWTTAGGRTAKADSIFDILRDSSDEEEEGERGSDSGVRGRRKKSGQREVNEKRRRGASGGGMSTHLSVVIEEDENEMLDLLDQQSMLQKVTLVGNEKCANKSERKKPGKRQKGKRGDTEREKGGNSEDEETGPFKTNKEGKLLIADLDKKQRKRRNSKKEAIPKKGAKRRKGGEKAKHDEDGGVRNSDGESSAGGSQ